MLSMFKSETVPKDILREATFHQSSVTNSYRASPHEGALHDITERLDGLSADRMLVFSSKVQLKDGTIKHIPMMDFHCPVSAYSADIVQFVASQFNVGDGFLVETDKSYHFYGSELLDQKALVEFLARALLFTPIVDRAWISHQLIELCCALRISSRQPARKPLAVI